MRVTVIPIINGALEQSPKVSRKNWENWKSEEESWLSRLHHCSARLIRKVLET